MSEVTNPTTESTDWLHQVLKWLNYNRGLVAGLVLFGLVFAWPTGCASKTGAIREPGQLITAGQLEAEAITLQLELDQKKAQLDARIAAYNAEIEAVNAQLERGVADLQRQDEIKAQLIDFAGSTASAIASGGFTAPAAINSLVTLGALVVGGGAVYDNIRKRKVIVRLKNGS